MPFKTWAVGEEVLAADFNSYVQRQVVAAFPNAAARTAALASPTKGMLTWLDDVARYEKWDGAAWQPIFPGIPLGAGQIAMAGTYSGQPLQTRGWKQTLSTSGTGTFTAAFPAPVNGVLVVFAQYTGAFGIFVVVNSATTSVI